MNARVLSAVFALLLASQVQAQRPDSGRASLRWSGYIQVRQTYQSQVGLTSTINRARLSAAGSVPGNITWRVQGEFRTGGVGTGRASVSLQDAYVRWSRGGLGLQVGQFKTPFSREFITSLAEVETADRAFVVDTLAPKRDQGLMMDYARGGTAMLAVGLFNGDGQNVTANTDSSLLGVTRVTYRPVPFVVVGANVARHFADSTRYGLDASLESPWVVLRGEYVGQHRDLDGRDDHGWYLLAAAPLTSWLQPLVKLERFERGSPSAEPLRAWTVGANFRPWGRAVRLTVEYVSRKNGGTRARRGLALAQAQVLF